MMGFRVLGSRFLALWVGACRVLGIGLRAWGLGF